MYQAKLSFKTEGSTSTITVWRAPWSAPKWKLLKETKKNYKTPQKTNFIPPPIKKIGKKKPFKAFGNYPKNKQQMKKHLFRKIYKYLVGKVSICGFSGRLLPDTPPPPTHTLCSQLSEVETPLQTPAAKNTKSFPLSATSWKALFLRETGLKCFSSCPQLSVAETQS